MDINQTTAPKETIYAPFRPDEEAPYIFISYSHRDRERVFPIITRLYEKGWRVWYDEGLEVTENYYTSLSRHIKGCTVFLLFLTENSVKSEFVSEHELLLATTMRKRIAVCRLDENAEFEGEAKDAIDIATVSKKNPKTDEAGLEAALESIDELRRFAPRKAEGFKVQAHQVEVLLSDEADEYDFIKCEGGVRLIRYNGSASHVEIPKIFKGQPVVELAIGGWDNHLVSLRIPPTVKRIHFLSFRCCEDFTDIYIPASVEQIDENWESYYQFWDISTFTVHCAENTAAYRHAEKFPKTIRIVTDPSLDISEAIEPAAVPETAGEHFAFCSYIEDQNGDAERIIQRLVTDGCKVVSSSSLSGREKGKSYRDAVCMIVFLSQEYIDGDEVDYLYRAIEGNKPFILYVLDGCMLPDDIDIAKIHDQQLRFDNGTEADRIAKLIAWLDQNGCVSGSTDIPDYEYTTDQDGGIILSKYTGKEKEVVVSDSYGGHPVVALYGTFQHSAVTAVTIPQGVKQIGPRAFFACDQLTAVNIPDSVEKIGERAFGDCKSLQSLSFPDRMIQVNLNAFNGSAWYEEQCGLIYVGKSAFRFHDQYPAGAEIQLRIQLGTTCIGNAAFSECSKLTSITIPDSVEHIGAYAFFNCEKLDRILIPESVISIGDHAFGLCKGLRNATIGDAVRTIGRNAFDECQNLESVTIGRSVKTIEAEAFYSCVKLKSITIPKTVTDIHDRAFGYYLYDSYLQDIIKKIDDFTIYGYPGSKAEEYARSNDFTFIPIGEG